MLSPAVPPEIRTPSARAAGAETRATSAAMSAARPSSEPVLTLPSPFMTEKRCWRSLAGRPADFAGGAHRCKQRASRYTGFRDPGQERSAGSLQRENGDTATAASTAAARDCRWIDACQCCGGAATSDGSVTQITKTMEGLRNGAPPLSRRHRPGRSGCWAASGAGVEPQLQDPQAVVVVLPEVILETRVEESDRRAAAGRHGGGIQHRVDRDRGEI